jgi:hypothetical protein
MERTKTSMLIALVSMCLIACAILGVRFIADAYGRATKHISSLQSPPEPIRLAI